MTNMSEYLDSCTRDCSEGEMSPDEAIRRSVPACIACTAEMLRAILPNHPFDYEGIRPFQCASCGKYQTGDRWWCDHCCESDICFECVQDVEATAVAPCTAPVHYARRLLREISIREKDEGIPYVGALLTTRANIEVFKSRVERSLSGARIKDYKVGFQRIVPLPGDDSYVVAHMSSHTARNLLLYPELCGCASRIETASATDEGVFFGVRACDPVFGGDSSRPLGAQFITACPEAPLGAKPRFTFAEIFAGIGGFRLGLEPLGGACVFTSELNEAARATMAANYPPACTAGDITGVYATQLPDFDILTAGFPCQPFSIRGGQGGLDDPRGQLFRELIRIMKVKRPKGFIFENVPGLVYLNGGKQHKLGEPVSTDIGETFRYILEQFASIGYDLSWRIIDSKHWLAQSRQRVYITGFRVDLGVVAEEFWPEAGLSCDGPGIGATVRHILESEPHCLVQLTRQQWEKQCTPAHLERANQWKGLVGGPRSKEIKLDEKGPTLTSGYKNPANEASKYVFEEADGTRRDVPRFLTPRECCRLMGFPDSFRFPIANGRSAKGKVLTGEQSEGLFYSQIGNAVCPPVIQAIGAEVLRGLLL